MNGYLKADTSMLSKMASPSSLLPCVQEHRNPIWCHCLGRHTHQTWWGSHSGGRSPKGGTPVGPNSSHVCHQHLARYHEISLRSCQNPPLSPLLHGICYTTQQGRWQQGHNIFHFTPGHCAVISPLVRHITITHFQDQGNTHYDDIITSMPTEK